MEKLRFQKVKTGPMSHIGETVKPWFEPMPVHQPLSCRFRGAEGKKRLRKPASRELEAQRDESGTTKFSLLEDPFKNTHPSVGGAQQFPLNLRRTIYYKIEMPLYFYLLIERRVHAASNLPIKKDPGWEREGTGVLVLPLLLTDLCNSSPPVCTSSHSHFLSVKWVRWTRQPLVL